MFFFYVLGHEKEIINNQRRQLESTRTTVDQMMIKPIFESTRLSKGEKADPGGS
jgi:hypothetical protein